MRMRGLKRKLEPVQYKVGETVMYTTAAAAQLEAVIDKVYTDDAEAYYDIRLVDGTIRQTVGERLQRILQ